MGRRTSTRVVFAALAALVCTALLGGSAGASSFTITPGGPAVMVTISTSGTTATATFSGTAGQRVSLDILSSTIASSKVSLLRPNGAAVFTVSVARTAKFVDTNTLPGTGTYKLVIDPNRTYTGKMKLQLYAVPADASGSAGTPTQGGAGATVATTVPGQNAYVTFAGTSGLRVALGLTGVTVSAGSVTVLNPDGTVLAPPRAFATADSFIDPLTLAQNGAYKVVLDPKSKAKGSVTVTAYAVPADTSASLTLGSPATATLGTPGQRAGFTFTGSASQRISLNVESSDFTGTAYLLKPDLSVLASAPVGPAGGFLEPVVLPVPGAYTVLIDPSGGATGALTFVAYDVPADTTAPITAGGSAVTVTNTVPGQNGYLTFTGTATQKISVLVSNVSGIDPGQLNVLKPDGTPLLASALTVTGSGAWLQPTTLPVNGAYKILLDPTRAGVGSADVNLYTVPADLSGTIAAGTPLSVATTAPGQNAKYSFTGTSGHRMSLNITGVTIQSVKVSILKPDGTTLSTKSVGTAGGFIEPAALPVGGTYKVFVDPQSYYYGGITLTLYDVPADPTAAMTAGTPSTISTSVPGQNVKRTFTGTSGQRLSFNFTSFSITGGVPVPSVRVTVKTPTNATLLSRTVTEDDFVEPLTLTATGTYSVTVDPQGATTGSITMTYYVVPADAAGSGSVTIGTPGQNGKITFTGTSGLHTFTVSTTIPAAPGQSDSVELDVYQGTTITPANQIGGSQFSGPGGSTFDLTLPANGTYTIYVDPFGAGTGSVTVSVS